MEGWNAAQNWAVFVPLAAGLTAYYYWPREKQNNTTRPKSQSVAVPTPPQKAAKSAAKSPKKNAAGASASSKAKQSSTATEPAKQSKSTQAKPKAEPIATQAESDDEDATESSAKDFAKRLTQARQGVDVKKVDAKDTRIRTVKQSNAVEASARSAKEKESSIAQSSAHDASGVADMLEPTAPGPSVLRITASEKPARQPKAKKAEQDSAQSKKARQNERKREEQRLQREEDEKQRKALEERQRRTAREARGEPAKNGLPVAKAPANSAWDAKPNVGATDGSASTNTTALLDTFDVESTSSSNAEVSTAATSTTDAAPTHWKEDTSSVRANATDVVQQEFDDSAWTTAGSKKKQKKTKNGNAPEEAAPAATRQAAVPAPKAVAGGKPSGFQALKDEYEQRTDVDANDASNWDA